MPGDVTSFNSGLPRLEGPIQSSTTGTGTERLGGIYDLVGRLEHLAYGRRPEGFDPPPLETYTTTPAEYGDVVRATEEYVRWFRRTYSITGPEDRVSRPAPGPSVEGDGGKKASPLDRAKRKSP